MTISILKTTFNKRSNNTPINYNKILGVNFLEKVVEVKDTKVTFSIWDLGGALTLHCNLKNSPLI